MIMGPSFQARPAGASWPLRSAAVPSPDPTIVYTDGACSGNPGPGGWAWAVLDVWAFALLAADEQMTRSLSGPTADIDDPALPNGLVADLETPETYKQAHAGPHDVIWRAAERKEIAGLSAAGTSETMAAGE